MAAGRDALIAFGMLCSAWVHMAAPGAIAASPSSTPAPEAKAAPAGPKAAVPRKLASAPPDCAARDDLLGISRIVEIDTTTGPRFGDQYRERGETQFLEDREVILTFDDGPVRRYTEPILAALEAQCTKATFFAVGRMAIADPLTLREIAARGHTIATHTWSHKKLSTLSAEAMKYEVELGLSAVVKAAGVPVAPFFRFPYLGDNKASLAYVGGRSLGIFGIHVDSRDFRTKSPGTVLRTVMSAIEHEGKGIILFHDIQPSTAGALAGILTELKTKGFKIVHMIPKTAATTLPEFDAIAEKAFNAKARAAEKTPLAERAATWPVASGSANAAAEILPWAAESTTAATATPASTKPKRRKPPTPAEPDDPWQLKTLGN